MNNLLIPNTSKTPEINFNRDTGELFISGISVPENAIEFYTPVIDWLMNYASNPKNKTILTFKLSYINTSSLQFLYCVLKELDVICEPDSVIINWCFLENDDDMRETGEDFKGVTSSSFNFIAIEEL